MKNLKELIRFAEELSSADKILCDAVAEGTYRLGGDFSEPVKSMLRYALNDLTGWQEDFDLSIFDGLDPETYLLNVACEEDGYPELRSSLFDASVSKKEKVKILRRMEEADYRLYEETLKKIRSSLLFNYYTFASRRDKNRVLDGKDTAKALVEDLVSADILAKHSEEEIVQWGLIFLNRLPREVYLYAEGIFNINRYRAYESKLILEIPYTEYLAILLEGKIDQEYFGLLGIVSEEQAQEALRTMQHIDDEELYRDIYNFILNWKFYKLSDYGIGIYYSQSVLYRKENYKIALDHLNSLAPQTKLENLLTGRAWENLGRNMEDRQFLRKASEYYQKAGNLVKALECEVL